MELVPWAILVIIDAEEKIKPTPPFLSGEVVGAGLSRNATSRRMSERVQVIRNTPMKVPVTKRRCQRTDKKVLEDQRHYLEEAQIHEAVEAHHAELELVDPHPEEEVLLVIAVGVVVTIAHTGKKATLKLVDHHRINLMLVVETFVTIHHNSSSSINSAHRLKNRGTEDVILAVLDGSVALMTILITVK